MAEQKETIVLDFQVDTKGAVVSIENLTKANKELREERKKLDLSTQEGVKRAQEINSAIDKNTQVIKNNSSALEKQRLNVGNYTNSIKDAAKEMNVMGTNLGGLSSKMTAFLNPVTAVAGGLSLLGAAYASSTVGAKDLEYAQNQLSNAIRIVTNEFASFISSAEDGEGVISQLTNGILNKFSPSLAAMSGMAAMAEEKLQDLGRERLKIDARANDLLETNAELREKLADSQVSFNEKVKIGQQIVENLKTIDDARVKNSTEELTQLRIKLALNQTDEVLQTRVLQKELEINKIKKDTAKQITAINKLESNLSDAQSKQLSSSAAKLQSDKDKQDTKRREGLEKIRKDLHKNAEDFMTEVTREGEQAREEYTKHRVKEFATQTKVQTDEHNKGEKDISRLTKLENQVRLDNYVATFGAIAGLFEQGTNAYKAATLAKLAADTGAAIASLEAMSEANPANAITFGGAGIAQYASGLVRIFANMAQATQIISSFSEGGYTGPGGKYQPAGIVHAGEVVWNQSDVAAVGGPARANAMRPSYSDGGIVANASTKHMAGMASIPTPQVYLSYKEFTEFTNRVQYKENIATA